MKTMLIALFCSVVLPLLTPSAQAETIRCQLPRGRDVGIVGMGSLRCLGDAYRDVEIGSLGPNVRATGGTFTIRCPGWSPAMGTTFVGARVQLGLSAGAFVSTSGICFLTGISIGGAAELIGFTIN